MYIRSKCEDCGCFCSDKIVKSEDIYNNDYLIWIKTISCEKCKKIILITDYLDGSQTIFVLKNFIDLKTHWNMDVFDLKKSLFFIEDKNYLLKYILKNDMFIYYKIGFFIDSFNILLNDDLYMYIVMDKEGVVVEKKITSKII